MVDQKQSFQHGRKRLIENYQRMVQYRKTLVTHNNSYIHYHDDGSYEQSTTSTPLEDDNVGNKMMKVTVHV